MDLNMKWLSWHDATAERICDQLGRVPVTPVPKAGFEFECEIHCCNKKIRLWLDPKYYVNCPYRPTFFHEEREVVLNRFTDDHPQPDNNVAELTQFWSEPGRTIRGVLEADLAEVAL